MQASFFIFITTFLFQINFQVHILYRCFFFGMIDLLNFTLIKNYQVLFFLLFTITCLPCSFLTLHPQKTLFQLLSHLPRAISCLKTSSSSSSNITSYPLLSSPILTLLTSFCPSIYLQTTKQPWINPSVVENSRLTSQSSLLLHIFTLFFIFKAFNDRQLPLMPQSHNVALYTPTLWPSHSKPGLTWGNMTENHANKINFG